MQIVKLLLLVAHSSHPRFIADCLWRCIEVNKPTRITAHGIVPFVPYLEVSVYYPILMQVVQSLEQLPHQGFDCVGFHGPASYNDRTNVKANCEDLTETRD